MQAALDRPSSSRVCPREQGYKCAKGHFWNELACTCFASMYCMSTCKLGHEYDPTNGCTCMDVATIRSTYYPSWATEYDI